VNQLKTILFQKTGNKIKTWEAELNGDTVTYTWGFTDGKKQVKVDTIKSNSRMTSEERALFTYNAKVKSKMDDGYVEDLSVEKILKLDPNNLTSNIRFQKPAKEFKNIENFTYEKYYIQRKFNGNRTIAVKTAADGWKFYSYTFQDISLNLVPLAVELENYEIPVGTILDGELYISPDSMENFDKLAEITRVKDYHRAHTAYKSQDVRYLVFDCLYINNEDISSKPYYERYYKIVELFGEFGDNRIETSQILKPDRLLNDWIQTVNENNWEGLVVWDKNAPHQVAFDGKSKRNGSWKIKPIFEEDVIATGIIVGEHNEVGAIKIESVDGKDLGACSGLTDKDREMFKTIKFPICICVEYHGITKSGALSYCQFLKIAEDKNE
jgi:ATP-dependent DNA ligase